MGPYMEVCFKQQIIGGACRSGVSFSRAYITKDGGINSGREACSPGGGIRADPWIQWCLGSEDR